MYAVPGSSTDAAPTFSDRSLSQESDSLSSINYYLNKGEQDLKRIFTENEAVESARFSFEKAILLSSKKNDLPALAESYIGLGTIYIFENDLDKGIYYFQEAVTINDSIGNREAIADTWYQLGKVIFIHHPGNKTIYSYVDQYYQKAIVIYREEGLKLKETHVLKDIGDLLLNRGRLSEASRVLENVLNRYDSLQYQPVDKVYYLLAVTNRLNGDLDKALEYALKTKDIAENTENLPSASLYYSVIGDIYREIGNHEESIQWYKRAIYEWEINNSRQESSIYRYINYLTKEMIAVSRAKDAMILIRDFESKYPPAAMQQKIFLLQAKAYVHCALKEFGKAEDQFKLVLELYDSIGSATYQILISEANLEMGNFYLDQNRFQDARYYLTKALNFPEGIIALAREKDLYHLLFKTDSAMGNYPDALHSYQKYKELSDRVFNEKMSQQIAEMQVKYESERKENQIHILQKEKKTQEARLKQVNISKNFTLGTLFLFGIILLLLWHQYSNKQKNNRILLSQKNEIDQKNITLQNMVNDKEWLLKEVHHRVKNNLQMVMSLLNTQSNYIRNEEALTAIRNSQQRLYTISLIHQRLYNTNNVNTIDMQVYINDLVGYLRDSFDSTHSITFNYKTDPINFTQALAVPIGLILNEAITNSIKHAFPKNYKGVIDIQLTKTTKSCYLLVISDNGIGFKEENDYLESDSLGMNLIKGLSDQIQGTLTVNNENGVHLRIEFCAPEMT
ncbi:tetratricopeptide repeat-containing sensor histidine kinase [Robertkochia solimangrovi]|uniref:tetratricopeptide repeat-containing sensor histidine kinase n=1 Tax=Robertkochia solimangrovi TaxID=2213046 RepID=UPI0013A595DA|nr:tetratricopeptide repeat protein [Robertkochia solimangrovi]